MSPDLDIGTELRSIRRPAMGAAVEITSDASEIAIGAALTVVATLERRWSRFLPGSELSQLNAADGPAIARPPTARVIDVALVGHRLTRGWFDPTRGTEIRAAGYRSPVERGWSPPSLAPARDGAVTLDPETGLVHIPEGIEVDLGGVAKGWAADVAAALLRENGAAHAGVGVGGDIRVCSDTRVLVDVAAPGEMAGPPLLLGLRDGGIAVSGPTRRRTDDGRHHLIDPFTGLPAAEPRVAVVVAASAAGAEMLATAAAIAPRPDAVDIIEQLGATAWLVESDGSVTRVGEPDRYLLDAGWTA